MLKYWNAEVLWLMMKAGFSILRQFVSITVRFGATKSVLSTLHCQVIDKCLESCVRYSCLNTVWSLLGYAGIWKGGLRLHNLRPFQIPFHQVHPLFSRLWHILSFIWGSYVACQGIALSVILKIMNTSVDV